VDKVTAVGRRGRLAEDPRSVPQVQDRRSVYYRMSHTPFLSTLAKAGIQAALEVEYFYLST